MYEQTIEVAGCAGCSACACPPCGPHRPVRKMLRGDTLFFYDQVLRNPTTGAWASCPAGAQPPQGYAPYDVAGCRIWFTAKNQTPDYDNQAVFLLDNEDVGGVAVIAAASGTFSVTGPAINTLSFPDGPVRLQTDCQILLADGTSVFTFERGILVVTPDVTRAT